MSLRVNRFSPKRRVANLMANSVAGAARVLVFEHSVRGTRRLLVSIGLLLFMADYDSAAATLIASIGLRGV